MHLIVCGLLRAAGAEKAGMMHGIYFKYMDEEQRHGF